MAVPAPNVRPRLGLLSIAAMALAMTLIVALPGAAGAQVASAESAFVGKINAVRAAEGMGPLALHPELVSVARDWTATMVADGAISHRPDLGTAVTADWQLLGENVGRTLKSGAAEAELVQRLHEAFMASSGHRANILGDYNFAGVGAQITGDGWMYVTVNFMKGAAPAPPPAAPPIDVSPVVNEAVRVSRAVFADVGSGGRQASYAVVARGDLFADALAGAALAADRGPVLYTAGPSDADANPSMNATSLAEIDRVLGGRGTVYLLGGASAVSDRAAKELDAAGYGVKRLSGASRVETSVRVAQEVMAVHGKPQRVLIARSDAWPDAVTGGAYAAATGSPLVLSNAGSLHPATKAFLDSLGGIERIALGGSAALSDATVGSAGATRVFGKDRTGTAVAVAEQLWGRTTATAGDRYTMASSHGDSAWAMALAQAPWAAVNVGPQLLVADAVPPSVATYLGELRYSREGAAGQPFAASSISSDVLAEVNRLVGR